MAAQLSETNVKISDTELLIPAGDISPIEVSTFAIDDIENHSAESNELTSTKNCLQVTNDSDIIMDEANSEIIKRKKLSLTLPLLNVVDTADPAHSSCDTVATEIASPNGTVVPSSSSSCKTKKIYESDDTFIQTIFSQTIKSTTVTPTDDDPSYTFEDFHGTRIRGSISSQQTKSDSLLTDDTPVEKLDMPSPIEGMSPLTIAKTSFFDKRLSDTSDIIPIDGITSPTSDKPTEMFAYFHQTIDEDEPPLNDIVDMETEAAVSIVACNNHSPTDACLDEFIDLPVDTQTNTDSLTNATFAHASKTNTITIRTVSCKPDIANMMLTSSSSSVPMQELESLSLQCDDNDDDINVNNTNASNIEQANNASEQMNAADAISSYDDGYTETKQNNTFTSSNSSLHSSVERTDSNDAEEITTKSEKTTTEKSEKLGTKKKSRKSRKSAESEKENISVRSSFSKFDALQKQNQANVRSGEAVKSNGSETEQICRACDKIVYKMEEMKAEKSIWHKNCFRCSECSKPLNVDTYESHTGVLYCKQHFKSLFSPKAVEDSEPETPRKPELIIRESQPIELPPDVVRSSDKTDLGLTELQQLNVKERYHVFENRKQDENQKLLDREERTVKRSAIILSKLAKFKAKGMDIGNAEEGVNDLSAEQSGDENGDEEIDDEGDDIDLIRAKEAQRERPMCLANMNDIKSKFESGHSQSKEERREERKQEIQNIRSRLFMGKQAKIKEMYQQAVADSEQCIRAVDKKSEVNIGDKAKSIKNQFETGELYKDEFSHQHTEDVAVFEQGLGKQSRSIFLEMDAKAATSPQLTPATPTPGTPRRQTSQVSPIWPPPQKTKTFANAEDVVKYDEKVDEVQIKTADVSSKFKFFETFKPSENEKKPFRITPPRDGVVKLPTTEDDEINDINKRQNGNGYIDASAKAAQKSSTTTKMLSVFRQMEEAERNQQTDDVLKPLKCFTPPADDGRRFTNRKSESDSEYTDSEEDGDDDNDETDKQPTRNVDEALQQAQAAARAKQLCAKFERWETKQIQKEQTQLYDGEDQSQIESTKSIRAKFESLRDVGTSPSKERAQVNRFV